MKRRLAKAEIKGLRFQPIESRTITFQFVTPSVGAEILFGLWFYKDVAPNGAAE
jgi:hypothetical protein